MALFATSLTAALLACLYIYLSLRVVAYRKTERINFGDGQDKELLRRMRAHGNFAEYAPFGVILLALVELSGAPLIAVAALGALLVFGRLLHAYSFVHVPMNFVARTWGMLLTFIMYGLAALGLVAHLLL